MVACPEVIDSQTDPTGDQYDHRAENFAENGDRLLPDVEYAPDGAHDTDVIKDVTHVEKIKVKQI